MIKTTCTGWVKIGEKGNGRLIFSVEIWLVTTFYDDVKEGILMHFKKKGNDNSRELNSKCVWNKVVQVKFLFIILSSITIQ